MSGSKATEIGKQTVDWRLQLRLIDQVFCGYNHRTLLKQSDWQRHAANSKDDCARITGRIPAQRHSADSTRR